MNVMTQHQSVSTVLASRAMLVSLSISQWSGHRLDRKVTDEVNQQHNAAADAGRYNKHLLPKAALAGIVSVVSETKAGFYGRTLPWMDSGARIMAAHAYLPHMAWIRKQSSKFDKAVDTFIGAYPGYVRDAQARLNGMFKPEDYPDADVLRGRFAMQVKVLPVPTSDDFRVDMSEAQAAIIRKEIEQQVTDATTSAVRDIYDRVAEVTGRMVERLNAYRPAVKEGDRAEGVFRDSLVGNIRDLIDVLPGLNITGDPQLAAMVEKLRPLAEHDAHVLRDNPRIRRDVAAEAQAILDSIGGFLA
ncbi:hypothetical protein J2X65_003519 [Ancylobacter sp. 3268]|uniref:hypothetical protein n=1 Tax=Ancylobacter sp. 3268 TaxID=2817752 RepID=UPI00285E6765|nr:hypothetical protein [Ancylobacter sp. 3268]MDR6954151.1 hypothetical protein [Ancylobacter sp. 3268]